MEAKHAEPAGVDEETKREIWNLFKASEHSMRHGRGQPRRSQSKVQTFDQAEITSDPQTELGKAESKSKTKSD